MFEKTLTDVVKGIRASKRDTALYISQCIAEIKTEINSSDMFVKANALQKLTFLQMMGYSMSWASFATIEVMSSPRFAHKRIGYLAASQGFTQDTEVILLTTNLLKKELRGAVVGGAMHGVYEAGLAINCISNIVTEDLARDLLPELVNLLSHPQPYLRKKAILCLFKLFVKYPQALRLTFAKLQQCLDDPNTSVVSCAVNVITELSDKNPKNYLHLAPAFFQLLTKSNNNWMLIKIVKLLGSLVPQEPRLARKLLEPLAAIVKNTQAKSLLYEATHTITLCLPYCRKSDGTMPAIVPDIVSLCATTLQSLVQETDPNLKYLGLVGLGSLRQSHPRVFDDAAHACRPLVLTCLSDPDVTIRTRALDLITSLATPRNLQDLVQQLLHQHLDMATGAYKHDLVEKVLEMCHADKYSNLQGNFAWYLDILLQLSQTQGIEKHAVLLRAQLTDVALRVLPVRAYAVRKCLEILLVDNAGGTASEEEQQDDEKKDPYGDNGRGHHIMMEILPAMAWIIGEYSDLIREALSLGDDDDGDEEEEFLYDESSKGTYHSIIQVLTDPANSEKLPTSTQKVYVQAAMKVFACATADSEVSKPELEACVETIHHNMIIYKQSTDAEVVERAFTAVELLKSLNLLRTSDLPGLAPVANDEEDSEGSANGDLLGMTTSQEELSSKVSKELKPSSPSSSPTKSIRDASSTLNYLFKTSPMKPVGAKAQRKKQQSPNGVSVDLNAPVDLNVFEELIAEEQAYRDGTKLSIEAVSFTQQRPLHVEEPKMTAISAMNLASPGMATDAATSFQHPIGEGIGTISSTPRQRQGDPFYLDSGPSTTTANQQDREDSRFGTIQLLDSDDEDAKERKKKRKKAKQRSKQKESSEAVAGNDHLMSFGPFATPKVTMYESEDEGDNEDVSGAIAARQKGPSKEFEGLAKVDLTTPLREDEVMPELKHRTVQDRTDERPSSLSKARKKKKNKKRSSKKEETSGTAAAVGDLLDLGDFDPYPSSAAAPSTESVAPIAPTNNDVNVNPINAAFDDLLGLSAPAPAPVLGSIASSQSQQGSMPASATPSENEMAQSSSKKGGKRPWMKATMKLSNATGSALFDWSQMSLLYRVYHKTSHGNGTAASVVARFENNTPYKVTGLTLDLKDQESIALGNIDPGSHAETRKIGPFVYSQVDTSMDMKGALHSAGYTVPIKLSLPATLYLSPQENISLEQVAEELASADDWASYSVKIELVSGMSPEQVKQILCNFLRAQEVEGGGSETTGTFAAMSVTSGARVRALVKIKERSAKVDLKSTNPSLAKALASDMKRLAL